MDCKIFPVGGGTYLSLHMSIIEIYKVNQAYNLWESECKICHVPGGEDSILTQEFILRWI